MVRRSRSIPAKVLSRRHVLRAPTLEGCGLIGGDCRLQEAMSQYRTLVDMGCRTARQPGGAAAEGTRARDAGRASVLITCARGGMASLACLRPQSLSVPDLRLL